MMYVSTRGAAAPADFEEVLLAGLAPDGGLYMPSSWPQLQSLPASPAGHYAAAAAYVMGPYTGGNPRHADLFALVSDAYAGFSHPETAPMHEIGPDLFLLELFHGPTLAFKDFAMQVLSRLMERALKRRGARTTILGATSGDTGAAAVEAFRGRKDIELFILFPNGRISDVQRKQMTAAQEENIHAIAIEGTFDDAQAIVKALFGDVEFRTRHALSAINSINWVRIIAQTVYYYTAHAKLGPDARPSFTVPTGNFGDIFAGFVASKMGLPMERLVIATNENDILARALETGRYEPREVMPTDSPSMDIQVSSNFERLLFEESGRDCRYVIQAMANLRENGAFDIPAPALARMHDALFGLPGQPRGSGVRDAQALRREGHVDRSAYSRGPCRSSKRAGTQARTDGGAQHRASGQVPRSCETCHGPNSRHSGSSSGAPLRPGALQAFAELREGSRRLH